MLLKSKYQVRNQNKVDLNCEMFRQTMKCECNTVGLILFWIYHG